MLEKSLICPALSRKEKVSPYFRHRIAGRGPFRARCLPGRFFSVAMATCQEHGPLVKQLCSTTGDDLAEDMFCEQGRRSNSFEMHVPQQTAYFRVKIRREGCTFFLIPGLPLLRTISTKDYRHYVHQPVLLVFAAGCGCFQMSLCVAPQGIKHRKMLRRPPRYLYIYIVRCSLPV